LRDEADDEFAAHEYREGFSGEPHPDFVPPKVLVTTRPRPSKELFRFVADLISVVPNAFFYPRRHFSVQDICRKGSEQNFSHVIVLSERAKKCNGLILSKLPHGPTAFFKVSNVQVSDSVPGAGRRTEHQPEILLNNFTTRLGRRVGRMLSSLFYSKPAFQGRQCVTFHNQRDYIFVRHHRYIFEERPVDKRKKKVIARLQELGPRFTLRLRWLQDGTFDTKFGAYEWLHRRKQMDVSRRKFHL
jgi:ribosome production factor 1